MKILLVTNLFPTPIDPERGIFTLQLVKHLNNYCNVTVVCPLPWFPNWKILKKHEKWFQYSQVPSKYIIDDIEVYSPKYPLLPKISENIHDKLMAIGLTSCIKNLHNIFHFDAVNSQWLYPDSVAIDRVIKALNIAHIPTGLGCDVNLDIYDKSKGKKILEMLNNAQAITVVSNNLKNELIKNNIPNDKITVIPNGIDIEKFKVLDKKSCRKSLHLDNDMPIILYVGRLSEEKSVSTLIDAAFKLIKSGTNIKVYLVGDGPLYEQLLNKVKELKIIDNIIFVGKVDHDDISTWMGATDYFCLPSLREGCPNVILESLGSGRPVVASKVGAIPDIVTSDSGVLFTPKDIDGLVSALKYALSKNWDSNKISSSVQSLSWDEAAKKYNDVYQFTVNT